jgi:hypothetical protein
VQTTEPADHGDITVSTVEVGGSRGIAHIVTTPKDGAPAYRQTRFYRRIATAWAPTTPDAALWGPERSLETPSFIFHFRQHDAQVVIAVAPQVESLYTTLRRNFGLPASPGAPKLMIEVSVTQTPADTLTRFHLADPLTVPSPAVYQAPVELSDAELLAQSIALALIEQVLAQARERYQFRVAWQPLVSGLRLWQVWDLALALSAWRGEIVKWLYVERPPIPPGQPFVLPEHYQELCAAHRLWLLSPAQLNIPLTCARAKWEELSFPVRLLRDPPMRLDQLIVPLRPGEYSEDPDPLHYAAPHPGQTVALATLIEYAMAAYGRERLPVLMAGLGHYDRWETLIPAVYGVSPAEFEAGWQAYLSANYSVSLNTPTQ